MEGRVVEASLVSCLFDLYRGDFLPGVEHPWAVCVRRLQRSRMSAICARLSRSWEIAGAHAIAENLRDRAAERVSAEGDLPRAQVPASTRAPERIRTATRYDRLSYAIRSNLA